MTRGKIYQLIDKERERQIKLWGVQIHSLEKWAVILGEEFGEVCKAIYEDKPEEVREELIQLASVAVQILETYVK